MLYLECALANESRQRRQRLLDTNAAYAGGKAATDYLKNL